MKPKQLYVQGRRNPEPAGWVFEATVAEIERRPGLWKKTCRASDSFTDKGA